MATAIAIIKSPAGSEHQVSSHGITEDNATSALKAKLSTECGTVVSVSTVIALGSTEEDTIIFGSGLAQNATVALRPKKPTDGVYTTINYPVMDMKIGYAVAGGKVNVADASIIAIATAFSEGATADASAPPYQYEAKSGRFRKKFSTRGSRFRRRALKG